MNPHDVNFCLYVGYGLFKVTSVFGGDVEMNKGFFLCLFSL